MATQKNGTAAGPLCKPGSVANKSPKAIKASPRKKRAMGAKGAVKGSK